MLIIFQNEIYNVQTMKLKNSLVPGCEGLYALEILIEKDPNISWTCVCLFDNLTQLEASCIVQIVNHLKEDEFKKFLWLEIARHSLSFKDYCNKVEALHDRMHIDHFNTFVLINREYSINLN